MAAQRPSSFACLTRGVRGGNHGCEGDLWDGPPPLSGTGRLPVLIPRTRRSGAMRIVMLGIELGKNLGLAAGCDRRERERLSGDSRHLRGGEGGQEWLERVPQASQGTRVEGRPAHHLGCLHWA